MVPGSEDSVLEGTWDESLEPTGSGITATPSKGHASLGYKHNVDNSISSIGQYHMICIIEILRQIEVYDLKFILMCNSKLNYNVIITVQWYQSNGPQEAVTPSIN